MTPGSSSSRKTVKTWLNNTSIVIIVKYKHKLFESLVVINNKAREINHAYIESIPVFVENQN